MRVIDPGQRRFAAIAVLRLSLFGLFSIAGLIIGYRFGLGIGRVSLAAFSVLALGGLGLIYSGILAYAYAVIGLGKGAALYVKDGRLVTVSRILWARPICQVKFADANTRFLKIHLQNGGERSVPAQFFEQPVDVVARRLNESLGHTAP